MILRNTTRHIKAQENPEQEGNNGEFLRTEQLTISIYDNFANIQLNGLICSEVINPIVSFIIEENLRKELNIINLFIDTEGGDFHPAMKLVDMIQASEIPIRTIGWGIVASAGLIIFMSGKERFLSRNCSILSHNATFSAENYSIKVNDLSQHQEFKLITDRIMSIYKECTGKDEKYIKKYLLRDNDVYMSVDDAIRHGLCDGIIPKGVSWLKDLVNNNPLAKGS